MEERGRQQYAVPTPIACRGEVSAEASFAVDEPQTSAPLLISLYLLLHRPNPLLYIVHLTRRIIMAVERLSSVLMHLTPGQKPIDKM